MDFEKGFYEMDYEKMDYKKDFYKKGFTDLDDIRQVKDYLYNDLGVDCFFMHPLKFCGNIITDKDYIITDYDNLFKVSSI